MGQWISSKEFAEKYNLNRDTIVKSTSRADKKGKNFCSIRFNILYFKYSEGVGGYAGKILQIWNTPLSQKQVEAIEKGYPIKYVLEEMGEVVESARVNENMESFKQSPRNEEVVESANTKKHICSENSSKDAVENRDKTTQPNVMKSKDSKTLACKENKMEEKGINNEKALKENSREALHTRGHNNANEYNSRAIVSSNPTLYRNDLPNGTVETKENKEREWIALSAKEKAQCKARERILQDYESAKASGIRVADFLVLKNREDSTLKLTQGKLFDWARKYKTQGLSGLSDKRGVAKTGTTSLPAWAQVEAIKMWRVMGSGYLNKMQLWRELHIIAHLYVEGYSYEKFLKCEIPPLFSLNTLNRFLDSYLKANSLEYTLITYGTDKTDSYKEPAYGIQRDLYTLPNQLWQIDSSPLDAIVLDNDGKQIRPSILSVIDVYSGRNVAYLSETSDSNAVIRLMWKAFESMGKPQAIQFDNGKDYLSNKVQGLLDGLNIVFVRSAAYKGKAKAVVERRFRTIQSSYITAITSYIGRNGNERAAREQQIPKRERKSKDALGNPLKTQQKHIITFEAAQILLDEAVEFWNIDRVSRRWSKARGKSPMDLWSEANFKRVNVPYTQFLLYAEEGKARVMGKKHIEMHPFEYVPTKCIEAGSKVLIRVNINDSSEAFIFSQEGEFLCIAYDRRANSLTQEEIKTINKEYKGAIKRIRDLQKDDKHSEFIRRNARLEAEALKRKKDVALLKGVGKGQEAVNVKTYKTQVKEAIHNAQIEQNEEDNWQLKNPLQENKTDNTDNWDFLAKLAE